MTLLIRLALGWATGIMLARWLEPPGIILLGLSVPLMAGLLLYRAEERWRDWFLVGLMVLGGAGRLLIATPNINPNHVAYYNDGPPVTLSGRIASEPDIRDTYINYRLKVDHLGTETTPAHSVKGYILVRAPRYPAYHYGDQLEIYGQLETPPEFEDFSYREFLARKGIYSMVRRPSLTLLKAQSGFSPFAFIYKGKAHAHQTLNQILPEPHAALLNGILLGIETNIPEELYDDFNKTGASHVIVISGSNISLVVAIFFLLGQTLFGKRRAAILAAVAVTLYTIMVGADAAVVRAALMGGVFILAAFVGRQNNVLNALFGAGLLMTLHNPWVLWDVGFQLSFVATWGLVALVPLLEHYLARWVNIGSGGSVVTSGADLLREALLVTVAAQIATAPLLIYHFERLSIVSLLTNLLIVPVQPLVMIFGAVAVLGGLIFLPLGQLLGGLAWFPLAWTISVVQATARFSWAEVALPETPLWLAALGYGLLMLAVWSLRPSAEERHSLPRVDIKMRPSPFLLGGVIILGLGWVFLQNLPDGNLRVAVLDVGQGDAILITTPSGQQILIDGGPSGLALSGRLSEEMPIWDRQLDFIINTHPDMDHLGGLVPLLDRYRAGNVLVSAGDHPTDLFTAWEQQLTAQGLQAQTVTAGTRLVLEPGLEAMILSPGAASAGAAGANNRSVVLRLEYGSVSFLLPGDIEAEVERQLLRSPLAGYLPATVLKSPHHGSDTSSSRAFLEAVNPQVVVISVGADNRFGHPTEAVLARYAEIGATVLRTDQLGTVEFVTDGQRLWVETRR